MRRLLLVVLLLATVGIGWWVGMRFRPYEFKGRVLQSPDPAPDFELSGPNGQRVRLSDFRGKIVLLFFGYASCPDVCPTTMYDLARALELLPPEKAAQVQVIMISVDPERDTPERLNAFVRNFHPSFLGLTGTPEEIAQVATQYGIFYQKEEGTEATGYLMTHTATVTLVDREGYIKVVFPFGTKPEEFASDIAYLLR